MQMNPTYSWPFKWNEVIAISKSARAYPQLRIGIFTDAAAGNVKQAQALAKGVFPELPVTLFQAKAQGLASWLAPQFWRAQLGSLSFDPSFMSAVSLTARLNDTSKLDIAIGCGRQGAIALDAIKRSAPKVITLQILDPKCAASRFDAVICPKHDGLKGSNVWHTLGAVHAIDCEWLAVGRAQTEITASRRLVLIGAPTRHARYGSEIIEQIRALPSDGLCISVSRRTPTAWTELIKKLPAQVYAGVGVNPYQRWLSTAAEIYVTADSVNMLSEAAATNAKLVVLGGDKTSGKIARFLAQLAPRLASNEAINDMPQLFAGLRERFGRD
jgi:uncharacterized protein